ncbi:hypothetical protein RB195_004723 [Necator americanus]|uniref:Receptor L-domain domain-containing protein n=1 Tax=Necator americanus TaxID=51031 RepID=A0ABR1BNA9_NECAM
MRNAPVASLVIRGNRQLSAMTILQLRRRFKWFAIDLQEKGECGVPYPFIDFNALDGCKNAYGILVVTPGTSKVLRSPTVKLSLKGCIIIDNTDLVDVDFLDDITNFTLVEDMCTHEIYDNKKLCITDPQRLKMKFKSLLIDQSTNFNCETICSGGLVDEEYLATVRGCQVINGNLTIEGWEKPPPHLNNLRTVRRINGSLQIKNTSDLGDFYYLEELREITVPEESDAEAIEIVFNRGLTNLELTKLEKVSTTDGKKHTRIQYKDSTTILDGLLKYKWYLVIGIVAFLVLLMIILLATLLTIKTVKRRRLVNKYGFPKPPWTLQPKSRDVLVNWVKGIVLKNPLIWRCSDREVIWPYQEKDATHNDINVLVANNEPFLKKHMLPLADNAALPDKDNFLLFERVKAVISKEIVIIIGSGKNPNCVLQDLPIQLKGEHTYKHKGASHSFYLKKVTQVAPCTQEYLYSVYSASKGGTPKKAKRTLKIFYYRWNSRVMPTEYDEILQLAMLYKPDKTICISDRRKEIFSLIHMLHTYCYILKEEISIVDVLQLHTEKCNGTILDRSELVFAMAVVMEWAYQSRSLTHDIKKKHLDWCHSYAIMAKFMRNNPNIKYIHPDYLTKLELKVKQEVYNEGFSSSPRFSSRESMAVTDKFHRKNFKEHTAYLKVSKAKIEESDDDRKFWLDHQEDAKDPLLNNEMKGHEVEVPM